MGGIFRNVALVVSCGALAWSCTAPATTAPERPEEPTPNAADSGGFALTGASARPSFNPNPPWPHERPRSRWSAGAPASAPGVPTATATLPATTPATYVDRLGADPASAFAPSRDVASQTADLTLRQQLARTRVAGLRFEDEESLREVVRVIQDATGLPLLVTQAAEDAVLDGGIVFEFDLEHPISVKDLLNLVTKIAGEEVVWTVRHETVILTTRAKASKVVLQMHDIRALTMVRTDFIAPRIDRIRLLDELEDDDGGGPFGGIGEQSRRFEEEDVATLVQESIAPDTWDDDDVSIEAANGFLIVRHTLEVQRLIGRLLATLGA